MTGIGLICDLRLSYLNHFVHVREVEILLLLHIAPVKNVFKPLTNAKLNISTASVVCFAVHLKQYSACSVLNQLVCLASCPHIVVVWDIQL